MDLSRELAKAARRSADEQSARLRDAAGTTHVVATVATVTPGAAKDGTAAVWITWRGRDYRAAVGSTYTPAVGHRVIATYVDNQLIVLDRIVGAP